jgi:hypothetical protein
VVQIEAVERDEGQVHRVEHQLDAHERDDDVSSRQKADGADAEEQGTEDRVVLDGDHDEVSRP